MPIHFAVSKATRAQRARRLILAVACTGLALGAVGSPVAARAQAAGPTLLLLPFVVHTSEPPEYVRGGLADMLSSRFARLGAVRLVRENDPAAATARLDEALEAARRAGADYVLFGSFTRFGKGASLDVQCAPVAVSGAAREPLREIFVHSGSIGEIIPDLDELAGKVTRFARGELVNQGPAPAAPGGRVAAGAGASQREIEDLSARVAELEAAIAALQQSMASRPAR